MRSLVKGEILPASIKKRITECLFHMYSEDPKAFTAIVQTFSQEEVAYLSSFFATENN